MIQTKLLYEIDSINFVIENKIKKKKKKEERKLRTFNESIYLEMVINNNDAPLKAT